MVVAEGKAITVEPVFKEKSPAGLQVYVGVVAPQLEQFADKVSLLPLHMVVEVAVAVIAGVAFTVNEKLLPVLVHPFPFFTVIVPVYVAAAAPAGMEMLIGLAGKAASVTFAKPTPIAAAPHTMLYVVGEPVGALYVSCVVWEFALKHTPDAVAAGVIEGAGFTVTT